MKQSKKQKSNTWQLTASLLAAMLLSSLFLSEAMAGNKANSHAREGFRLYQARQYAKALPSLRRAAAENP
ncbi:MAG TPA: hypothetical protein PK671_08630, partial [Candidatus Obscuribacter sp.]|nr:hypothetical protein [Candidatus Obscuribacter sp.]